MLEAKTLAFALEGAVSLAPPRHIFSVTAFAGAKIGLEAALGVALPPPGRTLAASGTLWAWSGPGSWLAISESPLRARLAPAVAHAALTDQSDGKAIFLVAGARDALQKLIPIDLHESVFLPDHTALTLAGHIPVHIWREEQNFALACFRSFAGALHHALVQAQTPLRG